MVLPNTRLIGPLKMEEIIMLHVTDYDMGVNEGGYILLCQRLTDERRCEAPSAFSAFLCSA